MKRLLLLAVSAISAISIGFSQLDYSQSSNFYIGGSLGSTWHKSDVENINHSLRGGSFFLGGTIGRDAGRALSLDLRLRYMTGTWFGQDTDTISAPSSNSALSSIYGNDPVIQNFRTRNSSWDLELSLHANRLRETSRIDPYIFAGIGAHRNVTQADLIDDNGLPYNYLASQSTNQLNGNFESFLDQNEDGEPYSETRREYAAPSLGVGLGFYITNNLSIGMEHRVTFTLDNYFDGTTINQTGEVTGNNDRFHYTSAYLRYYFKRRTRTPRSTPITPTPTNPNVYTGSISRMPVVTFTNPSLSPTTVNSATFVLRADIVNVGGAQDVLFRQDGIVNHNFTFNHITTRFQATVTLKPGQNVFRLRGSNQFGSDEAVMVINYEMPINNIATPPFVNITDPGFSPYTTENLTHTVLATINNVSNRNQITVMFNGNPITNFQYNQLTSQQASISFVQSLNEGLNTAIVTATNPSGQHSDQATILRQRETITHPPVVSIDNPSSSPILVTTSNFNLTGEVLYVDGKDNVTFIQNGQTNANFSFNSTTKKFSSNVVLSPGQNIFQLIGTNSAGSDQKTVIINYNIPSPTPPIVSILNPALQPFITNSATHNLVATILNVSTASQISLNLNGTSVTNFSFNASTSTLNASLPLNLGSNTVVVTGTNNDGSDTKQTVIIYQQPVTQQPPVVEYIYPSVNPYQSTVQNYSVLASVLNVDNSNQINVNVNGQNVTNFTYNNTSKTVAFNVALIDGVNTIVVTATNSAGVASKSQTIVYVDPTSQLPPVVTYLDPLMNPTTVYTSNYNVIAKVLNVQGSQNIALTINGVPSANFSYSASSELMTFATGLNVGANIIEITATNDYGQDVESTTIVYHKPDLVLPPVVTITKPAAEPFTTNVSSANVKATALNVLTAQNVQVNVNGVSTSNFTFNTSTKQVNLSVNLIEGNNLVEVIGTNTAGQASDIRTIIYAPDAVVEPPYVTYINPSAPGTEVSLPTFEMVAQVVNVDEISGVEVQFNGQTISSSQYTFNPTNKEVHYTTNLVAGNNTFYVKGTNSGGSHSALTNVVYKQPITACDQPEIVFIAPSTSPNATEDDSYIIHALIHHVSSANAITLRLNGQALGNFLFDAASHELTRQVNLTEGNNVIEIEATNSCGKREKNTIIVYTAPEAPCIQPEVTMLQPTQANMGTFDETITIIATTSNIQSASQVQVKLNGVPQNFSFDAATHTISATLNLSIGGNNIGIQVQNDCDVDRASLHVVRESCTPPSVAVTPSSNIVNSSTEDATVYFSGAISNVAANGITAVLNGQAKNFVFDASTDAFSISLQLNEGTNNIQITATNNCETVTKEFTVLFTPKAVIHPPTVSITDPASSPYNTESSSKNITAQTTNVASSSEIVALVNGNQVNFNFSANSGLVTFNASLNEGTNAVEVIVTNSGGTASDVKSIIYTTPVVVQPPVVTFTQPSSPEVVLPAGTHQVNGKVDNLDNVGQLELFVNGQPYSNHNAQLLNGSVVFNLTVTLNANHSSFEVIATGTNTAGSDVGSVILNLEAAEDDADDTANCWPAVSATFGANHQSVTANSSMDLSNVVLQFSDGSTQKFEGLTGLTGTFSGTGQHADKCITGIWIKSGCNQSGDGPGFGEFVENIVYDGVCEIQPCEAPSISIISSADVNNFMYNFQAVVLNATANHISLKLNGSTVLFNFNASNNTLSYEATLVEGANTFEIHVNECEQKQETFVVTYTKPCNPLTYMLVYPNQMTYTSSESTVSNINLSVQHVESSGVQVTINGVNKAFTLSGSTLSIAQVNLNEGANALQINLSNACSNETVNMTLTYEPPVTGPCGPRFNPGNNDWQFCLITPAGSFNRSDLHANKNFTYSGPASSLYFLSIAGGGNAIVNGQEFTIQPGRYYLFEGNLQVTVSNNQPGSMGQWTACITADKVPQSGVGNNRPESPCEEGNKSMGQPGGSDNVTPGRGEGDGRQVDPGRTPQVQPVRPSGTQTQPVRPAGTTDSRTNAPRQVNTGTSGTSPTNTTTRPVRNTNSRPSGGVTTPRPVRQTPRRTEPAPTENDDTTPTRPTRTIDPNRRN
jgi:large repetitive protein